MLPRQRWRKTSLTGLCDMREAWGECGHQKELGALPRPPNGLLYGLQQFLSLVSHL